MIKESNFHKRDKQDIKLFIICLNYIRQHKWQATTMKLLEFFLGFLGTFYSKMSLVLVEHTTDIHAYVSLCQNSIGILKDTKKMFHVCSNCTRMVLRMAECILLNASVLPSWEQ